MELRTDELATSATALDKVELCGRHINVGRPKVLISFLFGFLYNKTCDCT